MNDEKKCIEAMVKQQNKEINEEMEQELKHLRELIKFKKPSVTASIIIEDLSTNKYLLIKRKNDPFKGCLCFPGRFLDVGKESIETTAIRECQEETHIMVEKRDLLFIDVRSKPTRDPRGHVIDHGFKIEVFHAAELAFAGDDAAEITWVTEDQINKMKLAFDHNEFWKNYTRSSEYISAIYRRSNRNK